MSQTADVPTLEEPALCAATAFQHLSWLAAGRSDSAALARACLGAIARTGDRLNAWTSLNPQALGEAAASDARRHEGRTIGRLDGLTVAVKDNFDVAGLATTGGLPGRRDRIATADSAAVARLRAAGAVILGKTGVDEGCFGTLGANPHFGAVHNPWRHGWSPGGSSAGSAAAVAAGHCSFALASDSMGSARIPASHCGVYALKPTPGEISTRGMLGAARRLDAVGLLARSVEDLSILLQVLAGHDPADPRSRRRRVPLATPDWEPGRLRSAFAADLSALGVAPEVAAVFEAAVARIGTALGQRREVDLSGHDLGRTRRAALLVMEAELSVELAEDLADTTHPVSPRLRTLLDFARSRTAVDYAAADRTLDASVLKARAIFADIDVLVLPTVPTGPRPLAEGEVANMADLTAFANLAACPAISLPMGRLPDGMPVGLQLVGRPGADLRLLELAGICAATLDAVPAWPVEAGAGMPA